MHGNPFEVDLSTRDKKWIFALPDWGENNKYCIVLSEVFFTVNWADIDQEVAELDQSEPFIVVTGKPGTPTTQFYICCESFILMESKSLRDAVVDVMSAYFVFDISYPKSINGALIFLQHHVFCLPDEQAVPSAVKTLVTNLQKV